MASKSPAGVMDGQLLNRYESRLIRCSAGVGLAKYLQILRDSRGGGALRLGVRDEAVVLPAGRCARAHGDPVGG